MCMYVGYNDIEGDKMNDQRSAFFLLSVCILDQYKFEPFLAVTILICLFVRIISPEYKKSLIN